ncbi:hypothetical protein BJY24_003919 [Nocardia transvalensis]|uniref:DUF732 domain-containing protein n=1 Tax=Nocardia transvalensis TaxID=37333 RepID=A0A7W9PF87_9NOCA|nr:DUF732 domain-containing protein [Nocardia transvalensis]MBB5915052.1 hypothetical protein [Nocardia transvalensis]
MHNRVFRVSAAVAAGAVICLAGGALAGASPDPTSASRGVTPERNPVDRQFLRQSHLDDADPVRQDAGIQLAHAECGWLEANGNSGSNQVMLAESLRGSVDYPYTFLAAAVDSYCPWAQLQRPSVSFK